MGLASLHQPSICASFKGFSSKCISCQICRKSCLDGTQKSVFKQGSAGQTMLGFIVELRMCPHIPSCEHNALLPTVGK
jgi:ferredoxin